MSYLLKTIEKRHDKTEFKFLLVISFILVALVAFSVGFIYANAPSIEVLAKLLAIFTPIIGAFIYYLCKKFNELTAE